MTLHNGSCVLGRAGNEDRSERLKSPWVLMLVADKLQLRGCISEHRGQMGEMRTMQRVPGSFGTGEFAFGVGVGVGIELAG